MKQTILSLTFLVGGVCVLAPAAAIQRRVASLKPQAQANQIDHRRRPLTLTQIEQLIDNQSPDEVIAGEIRVRGIPFKVDAKLMMSLSKRGSGEKTIQALLDLVGRPCPTPTATPTPITTPTPKPTTPSTGKSVDELLGATLRVTDNAGAGYIIKNVYIAYDGGMGPSRERSGIRVKQGVSEFTLAWSKVSRMTFSTTKRKKMVGQSERDIYAYKVDVKLSEGDTTSVELVDDWNMGYMGGGGTGILFGETTMGEVKIRFCDIKAIEVPAPTNLR